MLQKTPPTSLNLYYQNVRSLNNMLSYLKTQAPCPVYDLIIFMETWLKENVMSIELGFYNYNIFRHDRTNTSSSLSRDVGAY